MGKKPTEASRESGLNLWRPGGEDTTTRVQAFVGLSRWTVGNWSGKPELKNYLEERGYNVGEGRRCGA